MAQFTSMNNIVGTMEAAWTSFRCGKEGSPMNTFHFGWEQEIDNLHNTRGTTMVVNPPISSTGKISIDREVVKTNTSFTLQIYSNVPSETFGQQNFAAYSTIWDGMEHCFYQWLETTLNVLGSRVQMGTGSVSITRRNQSSNDQMFQIECRFDLDYFFRCFEFNQ